MSRSTNKQRDWIEAFHKGKEQALAHFFDLNYKSLCYFAKGIVQDTSEAEDIVAECFVKLWKSDREVFTEDSIKAFLYISCRNACYDYLRKLKVRSSKQQDYFDELLLSEEDVLIHILKSEVIDILGKEIESLPGKCKDVFKLFYLEEKKTQEIMLMMGLNEKAVRYQKAKAIELLQTSMLKRGLKNGLMLTLLIFLANR